MLHSWWRLNNFQKKAEQTELWLYQNKNTGQKASYQVDVKLGKPLDIVALKIAEVSDFKKATQTVKNSRQELFSSTNLKAVLFCPICQKPTSKKHPLIFEVYKAKYRQCPFCSHCYVESIPTAQALKEFYQKDKNYQQTYIDKRTANLRVSEVALPKAKWLIEQFEKIYGQKPNSVLDVGAGGGHFVEACRKLGLKADGLEISQNGRQFCQEHFGFSLLNNDFLQDFAKFTKYQIITFWGLLEHVEEPLKMLEKARQITASQKGLVVSAVPRWSSFSTAVQKAFPESIIRHLDPLGHIHCFTDSSLSSAYLKSNLEIKAAWYFGMDIYELACQVALRLDNQKTIEILRPFIGQLQKTIDFSCLSDEIALIGKPLN